MNYLELKRTAWKDVAMLVIYYREEEQQCFLVERRNLKLLDYSSHSKNLAKWSVPARESKQGIWKQLFLSHI